VFRHLRGETQATLRKELHVGRSTLKKWKKNFIEAAAARLRKPMEWNPSLVTRARALFAELSRELADRQLDL
jgi:transposase-like protein